MGATHIVASAAGLKEYGGGTTYWDIVKLMAMTLRNDVSPVHWQKQLITTLSYKGKCFLIRERLKEYGQESCCTYQVKKTRMNPPARSSD